MKIAIIDVDYISGIARYPNPFLMKYSSYHKQKGDSVTLEDFNINTGFYDLIYLDRTLEASEKTPLKVLLNEKTRDLREISFPDIVAAARPDYKLYAFEFPSDFTTANFVQFTNNGRIIKTQTWSQDRRVIGLTIVMDQNLWSLPKEVLLDVLEKIKKLKKIYFLSKIDFSAFYDADILNKFLELPLNPAIHQNFYNFGEDWRKIIDILYTIKEKKPILNYLDISIPITTKEHNSEDDVKKDLYRAMLIFSIARSKGVTLKLTYPEGFISPAAKEFKLIAAASKYRYSLLTFATQQSCQIFTVIPAEALSSPGYWDRRVVTLAKMIVKYPDLLEKITLGWNGIHNNMEKFNYEKMKGGVNDLPIL